MYRNNLYTLTSKRKNRLYFVIQQIQKKKSDEMIQKKEVNDQKTMEAPFMKCTTE